MYQLKNENLDKLYGIFSMNQLMYKLILTSEKTNTIFFICLLQKFLWKNSLNVPIKLIYL